MRKTCVQPVQSLFMDGVFNHTLSTVFFSKMSSSTILRAFTHFITRSTRLLYPRQNAISQSVKKTFSTLSPGLITTTTYIFNK